MLIRGRSIPRNEIHRSAGRYNLCSTLPDTKRDNSPASLRVITFHICGGFRLSGPTTHKNSDRMVRAFTPPHNTLPVVCVVTTDDELRQEMCLQLMPWFQVVVRHTLRNLAHWTREAKVVAVLMDVGTAGPEMAAKLAILKELRVLNPHFVLVTLQCPGPCAGKSGEGGRCGRALPHPGGFIYVPPCAGRNFACETRG
jgi:hypothetical protein